MKLQQLNIVSCDDWQGLYINGKLILERHSISWADLLWALADYDIPSEIFKVDQTWMEENQLPTNFTDLPKEIFLTC